jgi:hypothetical protein
MLADFGISTNEDPLQRWPGGYMERGLSDGTAGPDRFSTSDEIQVALYCLPDPFMERAKDGLWEVDSDLGGHVLVETEDDDVLALLEKLDTTAN